MSNHIDYDMMDQLGQLGHIVSCQIISIITWWISRVSQVKLDHVKPYILLHDESVRSVRSNYIMSNHIDYDMIEKSGQSGQMV